MSSNAPQSQDDPFAPKPVHRGLRSVRSVGRGKNRHYEFEGQQAGETVKKVFRKHKFFLITPALPLVGTTIALLVVLALDINFSQAGPLWTFLALIFGVLFIVTGAYFIYNDFLLWWLETVIITNKRILTWKGFLTPSRQQTPIEKVTQVAVDQKNLLSTLLSYGDVHLYLVGGKGLILEKMPNPKGLRDEFNKIADEAKKNKTPSTKHPQPQNPNLLEVLAKLAKDEEPQPLPDPDKEKYAHLHPPHRLRGPKRTFGGPLRIPCDVRYTSDENTVKYIQRSKYVLAGRLIPPVVLLLVAIVVALYVPPLLLSMSIAILVILVAMGLIVVDYVDDVYILTTKRVIDIERKFIFFYEEHDTTQYDQIKDIRVKMRNVLERFLNIGDVFIETPGNNPDITFSLVDDPFSIQDQIYFLKDYKGKVDKINAKNERKKELNEWFGTVLNTIEKEVLDRGVPNLQKLDLWTASRRASALGWLVVPVGEDTSHPNIDPGIIVDQDPQPGTLIVFNPDNREERPKIRVTLSARP